MQRTPGMRRRAVTAVLVGLALLLTGACAPAAPEAGLVDVGDGRRIWLECRGSGSPLVVLVAGAAGAHDDWTFVLDGPAPRPSESAVLTEVSRFTRVCAYDRPGTTRFTGELAPSTPVAQPTTAQAGVADLDALLAAAGEPGPYVLVGASWGGMIVNLFARTHPADVAGLVFVDGASEFLAETLTPEQWDAWMRAVAASAASPQGEVPDYAAAVAEVRAAPAMPAVPAAVLTADEPWDLPLGDVPSSWPAWLRAQDRLTGLLQATHVTRTGAGHPINLENPRVVADAVRTVVESAPEN